MPAWNTADSQGSMRLREVEVSARQQQSEARLSCPNGYQSARRNLSHLIWYGLKTRTQLELAD